MQLKKEEMKTSEKIKLALKENYSDRPEVDMIRLVLEKLAAGEYVPKESLRKSILEYVNLCEQLLDKSMELAVRSHLNSEMQSKVIKIYESEIDEIVDMS